MAFNAATAAIWPKIEAGCLPREVAGDLAQLYGLSPERSAGDVKALFAELSGLGVLDCARVAPEGRRQADGRSSRTTARSADHNARRRAPVYRSSYGGHRIFAPALPWANERDDKADRSIRVTWPASDAMVSLDSRPRGFARSLEEAIGAIYELLLEALHPNVEWLALFHASAVATGQRCTFVSCTLRQRREHAGNLALAGSLRLSFGRSRWRLRGRPSRVAISARHQSQAW